MSAKGKIHVWKRYTRTSSGPAWPWVSWCGREFPEEDQAGPTSGALGAADCIACLRAIVGHYGREARYARKFGKMAADRLAEVSR